jgi:hypothetical protein
MSEKTISELEREKLQWEIRALKRAARPRGFTTFLLLLAVIGLMAYFGDRWVRIQSDRTATNQMALERKELELQQRELEMARRQPIPGQPENRPAVPTGIPSEEADALNARVAELEAQLAECVALKDDAWSRQVEIRESLNRIDTIWRGLPERLTFAQLQHLEALEDELIALRAIIEENPDQP